MDWVIVVLLFTAVVFQVSLGMKLRARFSHLDAKLERLEGRLKTSISETFGENASQKMMERTLEIQNTSALSALGFNYPVFFGGWSIDSFLAKYLANYMMVEKPKVILELGSGTSTVLIAKCAELLGYAPEHLAVDHDNHYLELTKRVTEVNGVSDKIEFWECPLGPVEGFENPWYQGLRERIGQRKIDLLLIDGPPGGLCQLSRYPALPALYESLSSQCVLLLDDASRPDEQAIVEQWVEQYPDFNVSSISEGHGVAVMMRG